MRNVKQLESGSLRQRVLLFIKRGEMGHFQDKRGGDMQDIKAAGQKSGRIFPGVRRGELLDLRWIGAQKALRFVFEQLGERSCHVLARNGSHARAAKAVRQLELRAGSKEFRQTSPPRAGLRHGRDRRDRAESSCRNRSFPALFQKEGDSTDLGRLVPFGLSAKPLREIRLRLLSATTTLRLVMTTRSPSASQLSMRGNSVTVGGPSRFSLVNHNGFTSEGQTEPSLFLSSRSKSSLEKAALVMERERASRDVRLNFWGSRSFERLKSSFEKVRPVTMPERHSDFVSGSWTCGFRSRRARLSFDETSRVSELRSAL